MTVTGHVTDPQGGAVGNASVTLASSAAGRPRSTRTDSDGSFSFSAVPNGEYTLLVEAARFAPATQRVTVESKPLTLNVALQVAGVSEDVTVQGALLGTAATGKTTLPVRDLPITIQGVGADVIEEQGVNDLVSALENVPGVNPFTTYGVYEYYSFRGFLDSVQLLDGMRNEGNRVNTQLTSIERVDVLKGPSSALYGGGALGATVNLIRKKPSSTPAYEASGSIGSWKTGRGSFGATGRLGSDKTLYRIDVGVEGREGYRHDDQRRFNLTPSLSWRIGAHDQLNFFYTFNRDQFGGDAGLPLVDTDLDVPVKDNVPDVPLDRNYRTPYDEATSYDHNFQVGYARQLTDSLGFRNTLSYRHFNDEYFLAEEVDFSAPSTIDRFYLYFKHHRRPLMNVAELTGSFKKGIEQNLVVGWEAQRYHNYTTLPENDFFDAEPIDAFNPVETQGPSDLTPAFVNVFTNKTNAFYAQDNLTIAPKVKAMVGGRFDIYRRNSHADEIVDGVQEEGTIVEREANAFTGRVGVVYQPTQVLDIYGSFATSFRPLNQAQPDGTTLDPETGSQFEVGNRWRVVGTKVQLNTAVYHIVRQNVAFSRSGGFFDQAGEVESNGFEADLETLVTDRWRINAGYGFTDAQFNDYEQSVGENLRGNTPVFAPRHTFNLWAGYDFPNGLGFNVGARYFGKTFADNENTFEVDGYGVLNAAIRYRHGALEYALNINNLTDNTYFIPHQDYLQVYPGEPINVLGTVRVRFR